ncbi:hypothetical protein Tco_0003174 [Tanacetum coccineum]
MRTRSQSRNSNRQQQQVPSTFVEPFNLVEPIENQAPPVVTIADNRTTAQLLEAPTRGYEDAIVVPEITADNFELKHEYVSQAATANFNQGNNGYRAPIVNQIRPLGFPPVQQNQGNNQNHYNQNWGNNYNQGQIYRPPINQPPIHQAPPYQAPAPQTQGVSKDDFQNYVKANDAVMRNMQNQNQNLQNQMTNLTDMLSKFVNSNTASTSGSGTLPSNTITNPKVDLKGITTRRVVAYQGPTIPTTSSPPKVVERETKVTKDTVPPTNNGSTKDVQPLVVQVQPQVPNSEPVVAPVSAPMPNPKPSIPYPSRLNDQKIREKANNQIEKFYQIFQDLHFDISFADALILMPKFASTLKSLISNKEKLFELARTPLNEHCSAVLLKKLPEKLGDPGKFLIPCDFPGMDECLALADLGASINLMPLSVWKKKKASLRISLLLSYDDNSVNRIDVIEMACEEYSQEVLGFSDVIASGNPTPYYDLIVSTSSPTVTPFGDSDFLLKEVDAFLALEDDLTSPEVDHSYYDMEGDILLLEAFLNDDPSLPPPTQGNYFPEILKDLKVCEAKNDKSSIDEPPKVELKDLPPHLEYAFLEGDNKLPVIIAKDLSVEEKAALIKVNEATRKDHFPLSFMDQMLERLAGNEYYCFLDGFSGYFQIPIDPHDQEKTTFTCPYEMLAYRRMPFGLYNASGTFQRNCLSRVDKMLKRCEDTNLCLNWEKSHFMIKEGIVLGHKISKNGIEVDKAKVDVIAKLPHPTTVKGVRSFLGVSLSDESVQMNGEVYSIVGAIDGIVGTMGEIVGVSVECGHE